MAATSFACAGGYDRIGAMKKRPGAEGANHQSKAKKPSAKKGPRPAASRRGRASRAAGAASAKSGRDASARPASRAGCGGAGAEARICPVSDRCGGCTAVEVPYDRQLAAKDARLAVLFEGVAPAAALRPIIGMADPTHYRNKVISPYAPARGRAARAAAQAAGSSRRAARGKGATPAAILTGMYERGSHRLIPTTECLVENERAKAVTLAVRDIMARHGMEPYDEDAGTGFMRHAVVRVGHQSGEVLVTLVTNGAEFPSAKAFCRELVRRCPFVTTVVQNVNTRQTNVILGEEERTLYGPGFILDTLCGLSFRISSQSFYQVNAAQTEVLYDQAIALAGLDGTQEVVDAYCGTGTIGLVAAARGAARVTGVDNVESAIRDARANAAHNGIGNAQFMAADAGVFMRALAARRADEEVLAPLVVFMDPPRSGSTPEFLDALAALAPERVVYISCDPSTQVRDVRRLARAGYEVAAVQPVDMFPHTDHIESVALLVRSEGARP